MIAPLRQTVLSIKCDCAKNTLLATQIYREDDKVGALDACREGSGEEH
jgi:hypothetical protein